jgi:hypothetical protein
MAARSPKAHRPTYQRDPAVIRAYLGTGEEALDG